MKGRLRNLETAVSKIKDVVESDRRWALTLRRAWQSEHQSQRSVEEHEHILSLAREIHARPDDPEVLAEVAPLIAAENEYVDARAAEYVETMRPEERSRWKALLRGDVID